MAGAAQAAQTDSVTARHTDLLDINVRARVDWQNTWEDSHVRDSDSGFEGKYLMMRLDGRIVDGITYSWRQRFNKAAFDGSFFDATDWVYVDWATGDFNFTAGKQAVAIGGWEYDRNPVDLYGTGVFWQNVACWQMGVSAGWTPRDSDDHLQFQVSQSMFHSSGNRNMYGYSLLWRGTHGLWSPIWSVNLTEWAKGRYINYIMLGNRFDYDAVTLEFDLMNRYAGGQAFLLRDCSVVADLSWRPSPAWKLHAKYTYDVNRAGNAADSFVLPGTELSMAGGGVEFYPLRKARTSLRLHANCYGSWGRNTNDADLMQDRTVVLDCGVTWDMNLFRLK